LSTSFQPNAPQVHAVTQPVQWTTQLFHVLKRPMIACSGTMVYMATNVS